MSKKLLTICVFFLTFTCYATDSDIEKKFGDWNLSISQDKLTDEMNYFLTTEELNNENSPFDKKYYVFTCAKNKLTEFIFIENLIILNDQRGKLDFRIDKEKPFQREVISMYASLQNRHITAQDIEQLKGREKLFIHTNMPNNFIDDINFSLKGFDEAIQPLLVACNISAS